MGVTNMYFGGTDDSFLPERRHRLHPHGAPGRYLAGCGADGQDEEHCGGERQRNVRRDVPQLSD